MGMFWEGSTSRGIPVFPREELSSRKEVCRDATCL